jgi:hypothetical protein
VSYDIFWSFTVALRLLAAHSTSSSAERNWTLWGRVYTSARTALGLERAKKLITFCFNDHCRVADQNDFHLLLETVENLLADDSNEAAEEAGGAAAAAASNAAVARGRDASPPAVIAEQEVHRYTWYIFRNMVHSGSGQNSNLHLDGHADG